MKPLFNRDSSAAGRAFLFIVIMMVLVVVGLYTDRLEPLREKLAQLVTPFYQLTDVPSRVNDWRKDTFVSQIDLKLENEALKTELLIHQRKLQQLASLAAENVRLRQLLNASETLQDTVLITELIGVSPNPLSHKVIINRGSKDGAFKGQPVLDAFGLMGQVTEVAEHSSTVLLISDSTHAIPVQVNRNGVRAIAEGTGDLNSLSLRHVSANTDIRAGDLLVSSGLGDRFPVGYPVAEVLDVVRDPGKAFLTVVAKPMARLDRSRHLLLVFADRDRATVPGALSLPEDEGGAR
ncbi:MULTISPECIES: rod shape-determining protein MreC [unclassified Cellvibrio]|uniref:rod shape-determining protein MreC n=2 Tax=unclassified Cellvibrio TaxID=2624793 RepID=UPI0009DB6911|nr:MULTISPECIES: rod shape-determining protein MreC [unclassified Cellvibrio]UUA74922.1 rod shape-determining protein MreC [Cellvibrio sp. QJXJ]